MTLVETLASLLLPSGRGVVSITGAGGKTSSLKALGHHFRNMGRSVLMTTTTKIQSPKHFAYEADFAFTDESDALAHEPKDGELVFYAQRELMDPKKLVSPRMEVLGALVPRYDVVIIEADGAKCLPLKLHTERDPVIIPQTTATLAVMGASALGDTADNTCFGYEGTEEVTVEFLNKLIAAPEGALKRAKGNTVLFINQADGKEVPVDEIECPCPVVLGSLREDKVHGGTL